MRELEKHEIERAAMLKIARSAIRLKYSIAADEEIQVKLPELEREINDALNAGEPLRVRFEQYVVSG